MKEIWEENDRGERHHVVSVLRKWKPVFQPTPYKLRKAAPRFDWLARLCWNLLHRLNALEPYFEKVEYWDYHKQRRELVTAELSKKIRNLREVNENPDRFAVIIGQLDFRRLLASPDMGREFSFSAGPLGYGEGQYYHLFNIRFWVVPDMAGWAVIPRHIIESDRRKAS